MSPLGVFARGTPASRTPHAGVAHTPEISAFASLQTARALGTLVSRLAAARALVAMPDNASAPVDDEASIDTAAFADTRDALRALVARSRESAMALRMLGGRLLMEGVPSTQDASGTDPVLDGLGIRLDARGIGSLTIREGASPPELLTLAGWLLRDTSQTQLPVTPVTPLLPTSATTTPHATGATDALRTWSIHVAPATPAAGDRTDDDSAAPLHAFARLAASRTDDAATASVQSLLDAIERAEGRDDAVTLEDIARACLAQLRTVGGGAGRVAVETAIRRLLHTKSLGLLASRLPHAADRTGLLQLLARGGDATVAALLQLLIDANNVVVRRAYFDAMVAMDVGAALLFDALRDERWYVVRNAASLLGEMSIDHADQPLIEMLSSPDERIRIAAARALLRLRTPMALTALQSTISDRHQELRRIAAVAYGLAGTMPDRSRPPAGPLTDALDHESDDDVALEIIAALGRLGSSHAAQRLLKLALHTGDATVRPPAWMRVAALDALVLARGHAMQPAIETLMNDPDPLIAAAAQRLQSDVARQRAR